MTVETEPVIERVPEAPILFIKTGIICSEPLGLYDAIADQYDADHHVADEIRMDFSGDGPVDFSGPMSNRVHAEMITRTAASLCRGDNVMHDTYLNSADRREEYRGLAAALGARIVTLAVHAPMDVILERIEQRYAFDELYVPSTKTSLTEVKRIAERMDSNVIFPGADEDALHLNGLADLHNALETIRTYADFQLIIA